MHLSQRDPAEVRQAFIDAGVLREPARAPADVTPMGETLGPRSSIDYAACVAAARSIFHGERASVKRIAQDPSVDPRIRAELARLIARWEL